jgi:hypothetical protein
MTQLRIEISANVVPRLVRSKARLVKTWPRKATKTATKLISMSLAKRATMVLAVAGEMWPPDETVLPQRGCRMAMMSQMRLKMVEKMLRIHSVTENQVARGRWGSAREEQS